MSDPQLPAFLRSALLQGVPHLRHGFFTRLGGVSPAPWNSLNAGTAVGDEAARVEDNLGRIAGALGVTRGRLVTVQQVHSARAILASPDDLDRVRSEEADALFTGHRGLAVGVKTADCVPMLVVAIETRLLAALHGGWRGLVGGVIETTVKELLRAGATIAELRVSIGPHIGPCCYQVGPEVLRDMHPSARVERDGALYANLAADARARWRNLGLQDAQVDQVGPCVSCDALRFYSHRRDRGHTGRQLSAIVFEDLA
ncbi:MAG: polyphenol oxidase family protein [Pseudomonadota bacterium]